MPRFPATSENARRLPPPLFSATLSRPPPPGVERPILLHLGDTVTSFLDPSMSGSVPVSAARYGAIGGAPTLRAALATEVGRRYEIATPPEDTWITAGALGALNIALAAVVDPGDEVILISPFWPNISGVVIVHGGMPVEVTIGAAAVPDDAVAFASRLRAAIGPRTVAIYACDPNNPAGFVLPPEHVQTIARVAEAHDLWVISDIAYADLVLDGPAPTFLGASPALAERVLTAGTFSKSFGLAGLRVGYLLTPAGVRDAIRQCLAFHEFHPSNASQTWVEQALPSWDAVVERQRASCRRGRALVDASPLRGLYRRPTAGSYVFLEVPPDVRARVRTPGELVSELLEVGVAVAPGVAFGVGFEWFTRICYTATAPDQVTAGVTRLASAWGLG